MSEVSFDEEPQYERRVGATATTPQGSVIGLMYKLGLAKTQKDANVVMGGIIVVCLIVSATMFVFVQPRQNAEQAAALRRDMERFEQMNVRSAQPNQ